MAQSTRQKLKVGWPLLVFGGFFSAMFILLGNKLWPTHGVRHLSALICWGLGVIVPVTAIRAVLAGSPTPPATSAAPLEPTPPTTPAKTLRAAADAPRATPYRDDHETLEQRLIRPGQAKVVAATTVDKATNGDGPQVPGPKLLK